MNSSAELLNSSLRNLVDRMAMTKYRPADNWPSIHSYYNADQGHYYKPHHAAEEETLLDAVHRYILVKGGEGGGKSVLGIIRDLERFKRGCNGIIISPDFEHFKKSLWPEFRRWCP